MLTKETQSCFNQTKKKKFLALLLSVAMVFALAACGAKEEDTAPDESGEAVQFSGSYLMGTGFIGYLNGPVKPLLRLVSTAGGLCLVIPGTVTDIVGIALIAVVCVLNHMMGKKTEPAEKKRKTK